MVTSLRQSLASGAMHPLGPPTQTTEAEMTQRTLFHFHFSAESRTAHSSPLGSPTPHSPMPLSPPSVWFWGEAQF